jgi:hypothetical protein
MSVVRGQLSVVKKHGAWGIEHRVILQLALHSSQSTAMILSKGYVFSASCQLPAAGFKSRLAPSPSLPVSLFPCGLRDLRGVSTLLFITKILELIFFLCVLCGLCG